MRVSTTVPAVLALVALVAGCADDGPSIDIGSGAGTSAPPSTADPAPTTPDASTPSEAPDGFDVAAAEQYCTDQGGMLVPRVATWNTNGDPSAWLQLAGAMTFCEFESNEETPSRISVDLVTLYSEEPTIAAIAYRSQLTMTSPPQVGQNPADFSCTTDYAASAAFGNTATVGGWVNTDEPVFQVVSMCVFPDFSAIDEFGLWYHANDIVRGADLDPILRYQPGPRPPAMFQDQN